MLKELLSIEETAEYLGVSVTTVRRMVRDGRIRAARIGRQWRIPRQAVEELVRGKLDGHMQALEALAAIGGPEAEHEAQVIYDRMRGEIPGLLDKLTALAAKADDATRAQCERLLDIADRLGATDENIVFDLFGTLTVWEGARRLLRESKQ